MQINFKKTASTLIETILVMTIIGVIAALTVPGLQKHTQRIELAQMAKKAYFNLDGALTATIATKSFDVDSWMPSNSAELLTKVFKPYLNVIKTCDGGKRGCFGNEINGKVYKYDSSDALDLQGDSILLADGIGILLDKTGQNIWIDVNASAAPNKEGVDVFLFRVVKADTLCVASDKGEHRICPGNEHTRSLMDESWQIKYW